MKQRLDTLLAQRGLVRSRSAAASTIRAGQVRIGLDGPRAIKPSELVDVDAPLFVEAPSRYVSRGGEKLAPALDRLAVDPSGRRCLDVGASTGGFTDCMLQRGAETVVALDVGRGQLDWRLRKDARVVVLERTNARNIAPADLPWPASLITVDVSFISLRKLFPALLSCLEPDGSILALVKPQFELGAERVGRGGVVRDLLGRREAVRGVAEAAQTAGLLTHGIAAAGLDGPKGNREVFVHLRPRSAGESELDLGDAVEREVNDG